MEIDIKITLPKELMSLEKEIIQILADFGNKTQRKLSKIMTGIEKLQKAAERETSVDQSIIALLNDLAKQLKDAGGNETKISAIADQMTANADAIAAAVTANTPAAPAPTPEPAPGTTPAPSTGGSPAPATPPTSGSAPATGA